MSPSIASAPKRALAGAAYLGRGLRMWATSPRIMLLGALPALIVGLVYASGIVAFALNLDTIAASATPFADDWSAAAQVTVRFAAGLALVTLVVLVAVYTFVAVTLTVGDVFYERIWRAVETRMGDAPPEQQGRWWRDTAQSIGTGIRLLLLAVSVSLVVLLCSLVPVIGQALAPVLGALLGGWILALELTGFAFEARRLSLRQRRRMLGATRSRTLGFGTFCYLLFLLPGAAIVVMPAAVAGATMLARDALAPPGRPES